jgi:hypothetical protein
MLKLEPNLAYPRTLKVDPTSRKSRIVMLLPNLIFPKMLAVDPSLHIALTLAIDPRFM